MRRQTVFERHMPDARAVAHSLSDTDHRVFWLDGIEAVAYEPLQGGTRGDLTIVGAGHTGLWAAVQAKRRDPSARVVLLESGLVGSGASVRNGGFAESSLGDHGDGRRRWPHEFEALERVGLENLCGLERDICDLGIDAEIEPTGILSVAYDADQVRRLKQAEHGFWYDADSIRSEIASPIFRAGRWRTDVCVLVNPGKLSTGLARAATELGVVIHEQSAVTGVDTQAGGAVRVRTASGHVDSQQVALCTNAFRPLLHRARYLRASANEYLMTTEPLTDEQLASVGWRNRQGLVDMDTHVHRARLTADNRILCAAMHLPQRRFGYSFAPEPFTSLASSFMATFPQLEGVRFSHRWAGAIDTLNQSFAFNGLAHSRSVAHADGFAGRGVAGSRLVAGIMLKHLYGQTTPTRRGSVAG